MHHHSANCAEAFSAMWMLTGVVVVVAAAVGIVLSWDWPWGYSLPPPTVFPPLTESCSETSEIVADALNHLPFGLKCFVVMPLKL